MANDITLGQDTVCSLVGTHGIVRNNCGCSTFLVLDVWIYTERRKELSVGFTG
jgi:hypothetical protein